MLFPWNGINYSPLADHNLFKHFPEASPADLQTFFFYVNTIWQSLLHLFNDNIFLRSRKPPRTPTVIFFKAFTFCKIQSMSLNSCSFPWNSLIFTSLRCFGKHNGKGSAERNSNFLSSAEDSILSSQNTCHLENNYGLEYLIEYIAVRKKDHWDSLHQRPALEDQVHSQVTKITSSSTSMLIIIFADLAQDKSAFQKLAATFENKRVTSGRNEKIDQTNKHLEI